MRILFHVPTCSFANGHWWNSGVQWREWKEGRGTLFLKHSSTFLVIIIVIFYWAGISLRPLFVCGTGEYDKSKATWSPRSFRVFCRCE